jgi:multidrug efflux pump subunit AcrA (membrane-fusion protein)
VIAVPAAALQSEAGIDFVFAIENGRARRRNVELGIRDSDRVEVLSGLREGDRIVTSGSPAIVDGSRVSTAG